MSSMPLLAFPPEGSLSTGSDRSLSALHKRHDGLSRTRKVELEPAKTAVVAAAAIHHKLVRQEARLGSSKISSD